MFLEEASSSYNRARVIGDDDDSFNIYSNVL